MWVGTRLSEYLSEFVILSFEVTTCISIETADWTVIVGLINLSWIFLKTAKSIFFFGQTAIPHITATPSIVIYMKKVSRHYQSDLSSPGLIKETAQNCCDLKRSSYGWVPVWAAFANSPVHLNRVEGSFLICVWYCYLKAHLYCWNVSCQLDSGYTALNQWV